MERSITLSTGVRLSYVEQGAPGGTPVIFLHGVTDSWRSFERLLALLPPDLHAFAVSQRGHGDSSRPASEYRLDHMAEDVRELMDLVGLRQAVLVGHSMGASVAQRFAIRHPGRTSGIVLIGGFASFRDPDLVAFVESSILPLRDPIGEAFVRGWQASTLARPIDEQLLGVVVSETLKVPAAVWHATFRGFLETEDFTGELSRVSVPALLMWGDRDAYTNRAAQQRLLEAIPHARLIVYEGAGHALHWEDPVHIARDLLGFLAEVPTPSAASG